MLIKGRWQKAQEYEQMFWQRAADRISKNSAGQLSWYAWKAGEMEKRLEGFIDEARKSEIKVVELGCGPIGIISYLKWGKRYAVDPLEQFYASNEVLTKLRDPEVAYIKGTGENLPFENAQFELAILDNVIDHVHEADRVLKEVRRVIDENGKLYLAVNIHTTWGGMLHAILSKTRIDKGHPYTFTLSSIRSFIKKQGFIIKYEAVSDYREARLQDIKSTSISRKIKAYLGLSEFVYYAVCTK